MIHVLEYLEKSESLSLPYIIFLEQNVIWDKMFHKYILRYGYVNSRI